MFLISPYAHANSLLAILQKLGLTTNLKLCLDVADGRSYPGSGTTLFDLSGGGYDFVFGDGATSTTYPTFGGGTYLSGDGGDYLTYDSASETWMNDFAKAGAAISLIGIVHVPSDAATDIFATDGNTPAERGFEFRYSAIQNKFIFASVDSGETAFLVNGAAGPDVAAQLPATFFVGFSTTLSPSAAYTIHVNGTNYSGTRAAIAATSNAPSNPLRILATGDLVEKAPSGARFYAGGMWLGSVLSSSDFTSIYDALSAASRV